MSDRHKWLHPKQGDLVWCDLIQYRCFGIVTVTPLTANMMMVGPLPANKVMVEPLPDDRIEFNLTTGETRPYRQPPFVVHRRYLSRATMTSYGLVRL